MSNIMSFILILVMAFSSVTGLTANVDGPVSFDAQIRVDEPSLLELAKAQEAVVPEETARIISSAAEIINAVTLTGTADKNTAELDLYAGEDVILSLGVKNGEEGATLASSLLGSQVIFVPAKILQQLQQEMQQQIQESIAQSTSGTESAAVMETLQNLDKEQIAKDVAEIADALAKAFEEKKGETETGEFTVDGLAFTGRTPVNMTYTEMMNLFLGSMKELLSKESVRPLIQAAGKDADPAAEIDKAIEQLNSQAEEEKPEAQLAVYTDEKKNIYYVCDLFKAAEEDAAAGAQSVHLAGGKIDGPACLNFIFDLGKEKMSITAALSEDGTADMRANMDTESGKAEITAAASADGSADIAFDIVSDGTKARILLKTGKTEDERASFTMDIFFGDTEQALLSFAGSAGKGGQTVSVYEGDDFTVVPIETLMDTADTTASTKLSLTIAANALKAVSTLVKGLSPETSTWVTDQVKQLFVPNMMTPAIQTQQSDTP